ncbi:hypothetical protein KSF73_00755 [Burkholderiaceae bacterium DAT-1]|nr:hypothetical protein [Burkholderiaceae bacterium DAT-1]
MRLLTGLTGTALVAVLAACTQSNGVDSGGSSNNGNGGVVPPSGKATGYVTAIEGAKVWLDINGDFVAGSDEPIAQTAADGGFTFQNVSAVQLASYPLMAWVPPGAMDRDANRKVVNGYYLTAPAGTTQVNVYTSMVASVMRSYPEFTPEEAQSYVRATLGVSDTYPILQNYTVDANTTTLTDSTYLRMMALRYTLRLGGDFQITGQLNASTGAGMFHQIYAGEMAMTPYLASSALNDADTSALAKLPNVSTYTLQTSNSLFGAKPVLSNAAALINSASGMHQVAYNVGSLYDYKETLTAQGTFLIDRFASQQYWDGIALAFKPVTGYSPQQIDLPRNERMYLPNANDNGGNWVCPNGTNTANTYNPACTEVNKEIPSPAGFTTVSGNRLQRYLSNRKAVDSQMLYLGFDVSGLSVSAVTRARNWGEQSFLGKSGVLSHNPNAVFPAGSQVYTTVQKNINPVWGEYSDRIVPVSNASGAIGSIVYPSLVYPGSNLVKLILNCQQSAGASCTLNLTAAAQCIDTQNKAISCGQLGVTPAEPQRINITFLGDPNGATPAGTFTSSSLTYPNLKWTGNWSIKYRADAKFLVLDFPRIFSIVQPGERFSAVPGVDPMPMRMDTGLRYAFTERSENLYSGYYRPEGAFMSTPGDVSSNPTKLWMNDIALNAFAQAY